MAESCLATSTIGDTRTTYPSKWYSVVTTNAATSTGTSTDFVFLPAQAGNNDRLLATMDQPLVNGAPSGSSTVRYVHTDNLGSTQVTSDASGNLASWFDYAPYGSVLASTNTGTTTTARQFIGQFTDNSGLSYLNARYYNSAQGQFLTEDPIFLSSSQNLRDPQSLNPYAYSDGNPITKSDPSGKAFGLDDLLGLGIGGLVGFDTYSVETYFTGTPMTWSGAAQYTASGMAGGEGFVNAPETGGTSIEIALATMRAMANIGGRAALAGEVARQATNAVQGNQTGIDWNALETSVVSGYVIGGATGLLPDACVPGLSCGQGNMYTTGQSLATREASGVISNISALSTVKSSIGSQAANLYRSVFTESASAAFSRTSSGGTSQSSSLGAPSVSSWPGSFNPFQPH